MRKQFTNKFFALFLTFLLIVSTFPQVSLANETTNDKSFDDVVKKGSYNPHEDYQYLDVRFWEDEAPEVGFYINHANLYNLTTVNEPGFGTSHGEWTVMDLLRGLYGGYYYNEKLTKQYFDDYIGRVEEYVTNRNGNLDRNKSTEWSRSILALSALGYDIENVVGYNYLEKLSESYPFSYRQGINGPIWEIIALNTGPYDLYEDKDNQNVNTVGKMIEYILEREIEQSDGTVGGWALANFGGSSGPDVDITGMALQALAPYYKDQSLYEKTDAETTYKEFAKAVERGIAILADLQLDNGGFAAFGNVNAESTVQAIVALTALGIDPISEVKLPNINKTVNFVTEGAVHDNVKTNNMIDKLLTFWAPGSMKVDTAGFTKEDQEIYRIAGGFKHVTSGDDGGGGSGTSVNGMATDQSIYGLIAYDRFKKGENPLYDMSDMVDGQYVDMLKARDQVITFENDDATRNKKGKRYGLVEIPEGKDGKGKTFTEWNSKQDGTGTTYEANEMLVVPEQDIKLYAQYEYEQYAIKFETNGGVFNSEDIVKAYTAKDEVSLPSENHLSKEGYTFEGWFAKADLSGEKVNKIQKGSTGDKTFYAKWKLAVNEEEVAGKEVQALIEELPSYNNLTLDDKNEVESARVAYNQLSDEAKTYVSNLDKLNILEQKLLQLEEDAAYETKKAELEAKIKEALETDIKKITNESATQLGSAVGQAENLLRQSEKSGKQQVYMTLSASKSDDSSLQALTNADEKLQKAINQIAYKSEEDEETVIKSLLSFEKARFEEYNLDGLSSEKKVEIEEQLVEVAQLLASDNVTQEEIDLATTSLQDEIKEIQAPEVTVDKKALEQALADAKNVDTENKTEESLANLEAAIAQAEDVLADDHATGESVTEASNAIYEAITKLADKEEEVDKDSLQEKYNQAKNLDLTNKTNSSKDKLLSAIEKAELVLNNDDATQDEVNNALQSLQEAIDGLELIEVINKANLQEKVDEAQKIDTKNKTENSLATFNEALAKAEALLENDDATQAEVDTGLNELTKAMEQLEEKEAQKPEGGDSSGSAGPREEEPGKPAPEEDSSAEDEEEQDNDKKNIEEKESGKQDDDKAKDSGKQNEVKLDETKTKEEQLPKTATTIYTTLLIGFVLLLIGLLLFTNRRMNQSK